MSKIGPLGNEGYRDWHNMGWGLKNHEVSKEHIDCMTSWIELETRLSKNKTIDQSVQIEINKEREHWKQVLKRIIAVVQRLAKNNLAFRGDCEKLYVENNGLFLQMIEMIAEFDPIMKEHIRRIQAHETHYTYLGPKIQNELIQMLANEVKSSILRKVKQVKYFLVILDCMPDASHEEQMSLVIRCVDYSANSVMVEEYWVEFLKVDDTSGLGLFTELKNMLTNLELDIDDIRDTSEDPKTKSEAESLATHELQNFEFLLGMVIWYKLLHAINTVSKFLQAENMDIDVAISLLEGLLLFLDDYRESGFDKAMVEAKQIANEMGVKAVFREKHMIRRKKQFDEDGSDEITQSAEDSFRVNYFLFIIDRARSSFQTRFEQFKKYGCICRKKFFQVEIDQDLSSLNYVTRQIEWIGHVVY
ncbi:uncharacterized protein LOC127796877 [Diospyros lotus]|uniref:uncharacterized protein LOC127796877 n=1 Tax=Diospyros lotus TaxID=55363 RepID=UPI00224FAB64|nr:uncharacterized protein LOC127796877 [Diospyros lotus]